MVKLPPLQLLAPQLRPILKGLAQASCLRPQIDGAPVKNERGITISTAHVAEGN